MNAVLHTAMKPGRRLLLGGLMAVVMAGCATPQRIAMQGDAQSADVVSRVGRFALRVERPLESPEAVQGGFAWRDDGRDLMLDLANPLGATLARVEVSAGRAVLTESNGTQTVAEHPDELVARVLGSPIPVAGLRGWLRGQFTGGPAAAVSERDDAGRPTVFTQDGWNVRVTEYDDKGPTRMQMQRQEADRTIDLRLVVTE